MASSNNSTDPIKHSFYIMPVGQRICADMLSRPRGESTGRWTATIGQGTSNASKFEEINKMLREHHERFTRAACPSEKQSPTR